MREESTEVVTETVQVSSEPTTEHVQTPEEAQQSSGKFIIVFLLVLLIGSVGFFYVKNKFFSEEDKPVNYNPPVKNETVVEENKTQEINNPVEENKTQEINETDDYEDEEDDYDCDTENIHKYGSDSAEKFTDDDIKIKGITLGMSRKEVESVLGKADEEEDWNGNSIYGILKYIDFELEFFKIENDAGTKIIGEELSNIYIKDNISTSRGIKIGSSIDDILNAYNKENISAYKTLENKYEEMCFEYNLSNKKEIETIAVNKNGFVSVYESFSPAIQFEIKDGIVSSIKIWNGPE